MYLKLIYLVSSALCLINGLAVIDTPIYGTGELLARFVVFCCFGVVGVGLLGYAVERE